MEQFITLFIALVVAAVTYGTPLLFGTLGEILTEKSGNLNLGVEGILFMGGAFGLGGVFYYEKLASSPNGYVAILVGLFFAFLAGAIASLIFSFITITLRANQNVTGLALSIFGTGVGQFMGEFMRVREGGYVAIGNELKAFFIASPFPKFLQNIPYAGKILFSHSFFFYLAVILAVVLYLYLNKSRSGLYLRAVGESPATADAAGINVTAYKYLATCVGSAVTGLGGVFYTMNYVKGTWANDGSIEGLGWLALALVIFASWRSLNTIWGSYLFGILYWLFFYIGGLTRYSQELFKMLPYVVTIIVLVVTSMRKKKENMGPAALGLSYFREDR